MEKRINIAALMAALQGDWENAEIASTPGGIEAQEAQGQQDFVKSEVLPKRCNFCTRDQLEAMGIVFGKGVDDLFIEAVLPPGWKKRPTEHSMWSELLDNKDRVRASIFYKAAFYDRDAFISLERRYTYSVSPVGGYDNPDYDMYTTPRLAQVKDCGTVIWESQPAPQTNDLKADEVVSRQAEAWLLENYPNYKDPLAYWED